jgi:hypothetical protein
MKKSKRCLVLGLIFSCGSVSAANLSKSIALWEQVDQLICVGQTMNTCSGSSCTNSSSGSVWSVDFTDMLIDFLVGDFEIELVGTHFKNFPTIDTSRHVVFLGDGRQMRFNLDNLDDSDRLLTKGIQAAVTNLYWDENNIIGSTTVAFECYQL